MVNVQTNYGSIGAAAEGAVPLNLDGVPVEASRIGVSGNALSATAYGNGAASTVVPGAGTLSGIALVNAQTDYGAVVARAAGGGIDLNTGNVSGSTLGITGNSVSATATGNLATNIVASPR